MVTNIYKFNDPYQSFVTVGHDYTTLTGSKDIEAVFPKGSNSSQLQILIHYDLMDEGEEYFTAELQSESNDTIIACATIIIQPTAVVLCTFSQSKYYVYESVGFVNLTLNSSRAIPHANYSVQVDTAYVGNASGER